MNKVRRRFGIDRVALVGDRGMLTTARIREDLKPVGLHLLYQAIGRLSIVAACSGIGVLLFVAVS